MKTAGGEAATGATLLPDVRTLRVVLLDDLGDGDKRECDEAGRALPVSAWHVTGPEALRAELTRRISATVAELESEYVAALRAAARSKGHTARPTIDQR